MFIEVHYAERPPAVLACEFVLVTKFSEKILRASVRCAEGSNVFAVAAAAVSCIRLLVAVQQSHGRIPCEA